MQEYRLKPNNAHVCRARVLGSGQAKVSSEVLRQVEQTDLIQYGLIPEFVGRFPIISSLQARAPSQAASPPSVTPVHPCLQIL